MSQLHLLLRELARVPGSLNVFAFYQSQAPCVVVRLRGKKAGNLAPPGRLALKAKQRSTSRASLWQSHHRVHVRGTDSVPGPRHAALQ